MTRHTSRRRLLGALGTGSATALAGCNAVEEARSGGDDCSPYEPTETETTTWPAAFGGPTGTAAVAADAAPDGELSLDWTFPVGTTVGHHVPIVAEDTVFAHDMDATVYAIDEESGDERWRTILENPRAAPTYVGDTLVLRTETGVTALDAATGERQWKNERPARRVHGAPPVAADGTVYVSSDVEVRALDVTTGEQRWAFATGMSFDARPAVVGDTVYVAGEDTYVRALSTADGSERWRHKRSAHFHCNVAVADGTVYAATDAGIVLALSHEDGTVEWTHELPAWGDDEPMHPDALAADGSRVHVAGDGLLLSLDAATGDRCWRTRAYFGGYGGALAVADGAVYAPIDDRNVELGSGGAFDAATGERLGEFAADEGRQFTVGPAVAGGAVFVAGFDAVRRFS